MQAGYVDSRFGFIDSGQGGVTNRSNIILKLVSKLNNGWQFENQAYFTLYYFSLISDFTFSNYFPDKGDEFRQFEKRKLVGHHLKVSNTANINSIVVSTDAGIGVRYDEISPLKLSIHKKGDLLVYLVLAKRPS